MYRKNGDVQKKRSAISALHKITAMTIVAVMLLFSLTEAFAATGNDGGFLINLSWGGSDSANYLWDTAASERKTVRMQVDYSNKTPGRGYAAGELVITVPGIGEANRGSVMHATDVAADKAGSPVTSKNWSYTYNSKNDVYTFVNNVEVKEGNAFVGSFELLWTLNSRTSVNGFEKNVQAKLKTVDNKTVNSNIINYQQKRTADVYTITQSPNALYSADGISGGLVANDYYWVGFPVTGNRQIKSLPVKDSYYKVVLPEGAIVTSALDSQTFATASVTKEGDAYIVKQNVCTNEIRYSSGAEWTYIYVAYPKSIYNADSVVQSSLELWGTYEDNTGDSVKLAQTDNELRMGDYNFLTFPGGSYTKSARSFGPRTKFDFHTGTKTTPENLQCYDDGFLNATDLTNGKGIVRFGLGAALYDASKETPYGIEFSSDFIDVLLNSGNYRQLKSSEYEYSSVEIPSTSQFRNLNNNPVESGVFGVDIYAVTVAEPEVKKLVKSTSVLSDAQTIALPNGTYRVAIHLKSLNENVNFENFQRMVSPIIVSTKFHLDDDSSMQFGDRVKTNQGRVNNNAYFKIFDKDERWINDYYTEEQYDNSTNLDVAQRDIATYGVYLERVKDVLHVHEITSLYYSNVSLSMKERDSYGFNLETILSTRFKYSGDGDLKKFTMATILPDGVAIPYSQIDINDFMGALSFTGISASSSEIKSRTTATLENNYNGSGRVYVRLDIDLTGLNISNPNEITARFPTFISNESFNRVGANYNIQSVSIINDIDYVTRAQYNGATDNGNYDITPELWQDINNNGIVAENLSYSRNSLSIVAAGETFLTAGKSVATDYTNGQYFSGTNKEVPDVGYDGSYNYKLKLSTEKNSQATDVVFVDNLENESNSAWQGNFVGVNTEYAEKMGFTPTVYYSTNRSQSKDLTSEGWKTEAPADLSLVKSVAVKLTGGVLKDNSFMYVLINMKAPSLSEKLKNQVSENKYVVDFTATDMNTHESNQRNLNSNLCQVRLVELYGRVSLIKKDNKGILLPNVKFDLLNQDGVVVKSGLTTNDAGQISVDKIPYGNYFFKETFVPVGYLLSDEQIPVVVDGRTVVVEAVNQRKPGKIALVKTNSENLQLYVKGAVFSLFKADGTLIKSGMTTSTEGKLDSTMYPILGNLEWGNYFFQETEAPAGYVLDSKPIEFKIDATLAELAEKHILDVKNIQDGGANVQFIKYEILEDGVTKTTTPVSNAVYQLFFNHNTTWKNMGTYMTDNNGEIYISGLVYGDYYLKEQSAPQGYHINTDEVHFSVDATHIAGNFLTVNSHDVRKYGNINMYKVGDSKEEVKGSVFGIYTTDGKLVRQGTTSEEGVIDFNNMEWGNYYIQEISAPLGYQLNTNKYFVDIGRENVDSVIIQNVINNQVKGKVRLTKMAEGNPDVKLPGAEYALYKNDGSLVGTYTSDKNGEILVTELAWGSYYFEEVKAPAGYGLSADKIRFSVNAVSSASVQELDAFDLALSAQITLTKKVKADTLVFAHGDPTFTFKVTGTDINGISHTYYKALTFTMDYLATHQPDAQGYVSASVVFAQIVGGNYTASEESVIRYVQDSIEGVEGGVVTGEAVYFTLTEDTAVGRATFVNRKDMQKGTSHTSIVNNVIKKSKAITGISANYRGTSTVTSETLDRSLLDVYALYDDGSQKKLADNDYTLDPENFEGLEAGTYTVTVSYGGDSGRVKKSSFQISIDPPIPFEWTIDKVTNEATITKYLGKSSVVRFPKQVKKDGVVYKVTSLMKQASPTASTAMSGLREATGVIIPEGIVEIGHGTFYNLTRLKGDLELPKSLQTIGNAAFFQTGYTGKLKLPEGLVSIGSKSFYGVAFSGDLYIPDTVTTVGFDAFRQAVNASTAFAGGTLHLSNKLVSIGTYAFYNLVNLTGDLSIPDSVEKIGASAFESCGFTSLSHISNNPEYTVMESKVFSVFKKVEGNLTIPNNIKSVGISSFQNSTFNGTLTLPDAITKIGASAFASCQFMGELKIPDTMVSIGSNAFSFCKFFTGDLVIPNSVETIDSSAFKNASGFESLTLPNNLKIIEANTFQNCTGIAGTLSIPASVTSIGSDAFQNCAGITDDLHIPESVISMGTAVFEKTGIISVSNFPSRMTEVPERIFSQCKKLKSLPKLGENVKKIAKLAFTESNSIEGVVELPDSITEIQSYAFSGCKLITSISIPRNLEIIGDRAFQNCYMLSNELNFPDTLYSLGDGTFFNCSRITKISFPNNPKFTTIPKQCFYSSATGDIVIPDSVTTIADEAFSSSRNLKSLVLPKHLTSIGSGAFASIRGIKGSVHVPDTIEPTAIGANAFNSFGMSTADFIIELPEKCRDYENTYATDKKATFIYY